MLIHFAKARFWVMPKDLATYAIWRASTSGSIRDVARSFWYPRVRDESDGQIAAILAKAAELGVSPGCLRYPSDGTRLQVFDFTRGVVCKMQAPWARENRIRYELEVRQGVGELAPTVLAVSESQDAFVEAWVPHSRVKRGKEPVGPIIGELERSLYHDRIVRSSAVINGLMKDGGTVGGLVEGIGEALAASLPDELPMSRVHGDLSPNNVSATADGALQLLDWEYTREAVRTYDLWHYLYESWRGAGSLGKGVTEFTPEFADSVRRLGCPHLSGHAAGLHVLHLIERLSFLNRVVEKDRVAVLESLLRADIASGAALLLNDSNGAVA